MKLKLLFLFFIGSYQYIIAQDAPPTVEYQEIKTKYLPYHNPMQAWSLSSTDIAAGDNRINSDGVTTGQF